ncbi:MAG: hypothetical protein ACK5LK_02105, partial [Chthoniobacterales bacterium]
HDDEWTVIGAMGEKPQPYGTGGEIEMWKSRNEGCEWEKISEVTQNSTFNHSYVRRSLGAREPFVALWADGNPHRPSVSRLYFTDFTGSRIWRLPEKMTAETEVVKPLEENEPLGSCQLEKAHA